VQRQEGQRERRQEGSLMRVCEVCHVKPDQNHILNRFEFERREHDRRPGPIVRYLCSSCAMQLDLFDGSEDHRGGGGPRPAA